MKSRFWKGLLLAAALGFSASSHAVVVTFKVEYLGTGQTPAGGIIAIDVAALSNSSYSFTGMSQFKMTSNIGGEMWSQNGFPGVFADFSGGSPYNPFTTGDLALRNAGGNDWYFDDFQNGSNDSQIFWLTGSSPKNLDIAFDEGDTGGRGFDVLDSTGAISFSGRYRIMTADVPEPAALGLLGIGLAGMGFIGRRRRTRS